MHICGTHENTISKYNLRSLLPNNVDIIAGPGCPVCVCPAGDIEEIISLAEKGYHILSFGDMMRVPSSKGSLQSIKSTDCRISVIMGPEDAVELAEANHRENLVFFCIGFETTVAPIAGNILNYRPSNLYYYLSLRYVPKAVDILLASNELDIDAMILPGHASIMSGLKPYKEISEKYRIPSCITGFEPDDILNAISILAKSIANKDHKLHNIYERVVKYSGNQKAIDIINKVFFKDEIYWRGLGLLPGTGFFFKEEYSDLNISSRENIDERKESSESSLCQCSKIILGKIRPSECSLFSNPCSPSSPIGPCMVSTEGSCRIHYLYSGKDICL